MSVVLRAPFAALAQLGDDSLVAQYRLGVFACLFVATLLMVWVAHVAHRRGAPALLAALLPLGVVFNPVTFKTIEFGHPEEPLAATIVLAAITMAFNTRRSTSARGALAAGVAFGTALATKQWALLLVGPFLLATARALRPRAALAAMITALVLLAPVALGDTQRFRLAQAEAARPHANSNPTSVFWPLTVTAPDQKFDPSVERRRPPEWLATTSHYLVLALALALALLAWRHDREPTLAAILVMAALIMLERLLLDAYGTYSYHHWPFVAALAAYEIAGRRRFPYLASVATLCLWYISEHVGLRDGAGRLLAFYLGWSLPFAALLSWLTLRELRSPPATPCSAPTARTRRAAA